MRTHEGTAGATAYELDRRPKEDSILEKRRTKGREMNHQGTCI